MQRPQTSDPTGHSFALARIASYRSLQAEHHDALSELDKGIRHLDPAPGGFMVDTTERYRQGHLDAIAELERWVRVWERDLADGVSVSSSSYVWHCR